MPLSLLTEASDSPQSEHSQLWSAFQTAAGAVTAQHKGLHFEMR